MRVLAGILAVVAVACMIWAIAGMVTGRQSARLGWALRAMALLCFAGAVALNSAAR